MQLCRAVWVPLPAPTSLPLFNAEALLLPSPPPSLLKSHTYFDHRLGEQNIGVEDNSLSFSDRSWLVPMGKTPPPHSTTSTPSFLCVLRKQRVNGGFLPGFSRPSRNSPTAAKLSDKESEQFPERGQHVSDTEHRQRLSCAAPTSVHTVTGYLGHAPVKHCDLLECGTKE